MAKFIQNQSLLL
ncbi:hypothetical protein M0O85_01320, partial [Klebsiella pneumoniae]|nr:hypothetical protein [Klebsiella pneumoniae]MCK7678952.1 hypothetical protein [Klebsiella pneumoniae]